MYRCDRADQIAMSVLRLSDAVVRVRVVIQRLVYSECSAAARADVRRGRGPDPLTKSTILSLLPDLTSEVRPSSCVGRFA